MHTQFVSNLGSSPTVFFFVPESGPDTYRLDRYKQYICHRLLVGLVCRHRTRSVHSHGLDPQSSTCTNIHLGGQRRTCRYFCTASESSRSSRAHIWYLEHCRVFNYKWKVFDVYSLKRFSLLRKKIFYFCTLNPVLSQFWCDVAAMS